MRRLLTVALLSLLLGATDAQKSRRPRGGKRKHKNRCRVTGCGSCTGDKDVCETCRVGFAKTEEGKCDRCGEGCRSCSIDQCNACQQSFTLFEGKCERCASHCFKCDQAGPGGCNECEPRRMLHSHLAVEGEVFECLPCGEGCRKCTNEHGCESCDWFHAVLPDGAGCSFSWLRVSLALGAILAFVCGIAALCTLGDDDDAPRRPPPSRARDDSRVVRRTTDLKEMRRRGGKPERPAEPPPPPERKESRESAYRGLMPGYQGIPIVDDSRTE